MKALWQIISFMAVVNLLALSIFAGWLGMTGRLDGERVEAIRVLLAETSVERAEEADAEADAQQQAEHEADEAARRANPPRPSTQQVHLFARVEDREQQALRRMQNERDLLMGQLVVRGSELAAREEQLAIDQAAWAQEIDQAKARRVDEQFRKAVKQLELVPAKQAKAILEQIVSRNGVEDAVVYFDAMQPRAAAKVLKEFKTDAESKVATDLLEALRTLGTMAGVMEESGNANQIAAAE